MGAPSGGGGASSITPGGGGNKRSFDDDDDDGKSGASHLLLPISFSDTAFYTLEKGTTFHIELLQLKVLKLKFIEIR